MNRTIMTLIVSGTRALAVHVPRGRIALAPGRTRATSVTCRFQLAPLLVKHRHRVRDAATLGAGGLARESTLSRRDDRRR